MEKKWYQEPKTIITAFGAIATLLLAIATMLLAFNESTPMVVEFRPSEQRDPPSAASAPSPKQPGEPSEDDQRMVSDQPSEPEPLPNTLPPVKKPALNPEYVLEDGKSTLVSAIATSLSATFQNVESTEYFNLVIAPSGRNALRKPVMGEGITINFETDFGTYRAQVLSIDWNRKKATISITQ